MITKLTSKPEVFSHLTEDHLWLRLGFDDCACGYAYAALQFKHNEGIIHVEVVKWAPSVVKQTEKDWSDILNICRTEGCKKLIAANQNIADRTNWTKFIGMFGFPEPTIIMISQREI